MIEPSTVFNRLAKNFGNNLVVHIEKADRPPVSLILPVSFLIKESDDARSLR